MTGSTYASTEAPAATHAWDRVRWWIRPRMELLIALAVLLAFVVMACWPGLVTSYDPLTANPADKLAAPSATHWFGTDAIGRDQFSRVAYGAMASLRSGLLAVAIGLIAGSLLGLAAGFGPRWLDTIIARVCDALLAIPGLLLALALLASFGNGVTVAAIAIGVSEIPTFARVMRSEVQRVSAMTFVEAAGAAGVRPVTNAFRHVLPNAWGPVVILAALGFGQAVLVISALSYLGFGEPPPTPEWGALISDGQSYLSTAWWLAVLPGAVLALVVLAVNRLGHAARRLAR